MEKKLFFFNHKSIILFISICLISGASAGLITGSEGTAYLTDSVGGYTINIQVDYAIYDGTSDDDPLDITTGKYQIGFDLTHLGAETGHESDTILNMKRFIVHGSAANLFTDYGDDPDSIGEIAPNDPYGFPFSYDGDDVFFNFYDYAYDGILTPASASDTSKKLGVAMLVDDLPETLLIEIDELYSIGEVSIELEIVPEPTSIALFGLAFSAIFRRRK